MTTREAATVMLVRDETQLSESPLHVFMLRRNLNADFIGGAFVFPGGSLDDEDRDPALIARCLGRDDADASALLGIASGGLGFWVAAIRETFEEAGVLFARERVSGQSVDVSDPRFDAARRAIGDRSLRFLDFLIDEDLTIDAGALHVFSHWITPAGMPKRYDTWFFVAEAPAGHGYLHDDGETVASVWLRPADALERALTGELQIIFPTQKNLEALARFTNADALLDVVRAATSIPAVQPRIINDANGVRILLPGDPGYDDVVELPDGALAPMRTEDLADAVTRRQRNEGVA